MRVVGCVSFKSLKDILKMIINNIVVFLLDNLGYLVYKLL